MFGGHGLYLDDLFVALVISDRLYLKVDAGTEPRFAAAGGEPFVYDGHEGPVRVSYFTVPPEAMDSPALMLPWARLALQAAVAARAAAPARRRRAAVTPGAAGSKATATKARSSAHIGAATTKPGPGRAAKSPRAQPKPARRGPR